MNDETRAEAGAEAGAETRAEKRTRLLRRLALASALLMLAVVAASAWLRLASLRPACADWPACRVARQAPPALGPAAGPVGDDVTAAAGTSAAARAVPAASVVRGVHRAAASAVLLLIIAMGVQVLRAPARRGVRALLAAALVLALALSALGVATPGSRALGVLLGNLLGGLVLLAIAWTLVRRLQDAPALPRPLRRAAAAAAGLWLAQAALGAVAGAPPAAGTWAPIAHLALAIVAVPLTLAVAFAPALRGGPRRREGLALAALVAAQVVLGLVAAGGDAPLAAVWLHNASAACGVALLAALSAATTAESSPVPSAAPAPAPQARAA
ncbi:MAG: hypothetical protein IPM15_10355 [Betaproteobacteria bacterium]|nr:hypothetical protein [Betaproteobacteria bacterium]